MRVEQRFGENLKLLLAKSNETQVDLANAIGLGHKKSTVNKWIKGQALPGEERLHKIFQHFQPLFDGAKDVNILFQDPYLTGVALGLTRKQIENLTHYGENSYFFRIFNEDTDGSLDHDLLRLCGFYRSYHWSFGKVGCVACGALVIFRREDGFYFSEKYNSSRHNKPMHFEGYVSRKGNIAYLLAEECEIFNELEVQVIAIPKTQQFDYISGVLCGVASKDLDCPDGDGVPATTKTFLFPIRDAELRTDQLEKYVPQRTYISELNDKSLSEVAPLLRSVKPNFIS